MQKVSVIVPIYNVKEYLERCVKSIIGQTERNIKIILVDDGSTDGSSMICDSFAQIDDRITVLHKKNGGLSSARNYGLKYANSEYVCFVDSDDIMSSDYVEHLLFLNEKYECDITVGRYVCFDENEPIFDNTDDPEVEIIDGHRAINKLFGDSYVTATIACNKLFRKFRCI